MRTSEFARRHMDDNPSSFRSGRCYAIFYRAAIRTLVARQAEHDAEVAEWYTAGPGAPADWQEDVNEDGDVRMVNMGGSGYRFPHCIHGSSLITDYDNICGGCEDGSGIYEQAIGYARERFLRFNQRWEWINQAPVDLDADTRKALTMWTLDILLDATKAAE